MGTLSMNNYITLIVISTIAVIIIVDVICVFALKPMRNIVNSLFEINKSMDKITKSMDKINEQEQEKVQLIKYKFDNIINGNEDYHGE